jgi:hypothetical protein
MYNYVMSVNEKFGCLLYSTDLKSIHQEEQAYRRHDKRVVNKRVRVREQRLVKPIDFFLYNEIIVSNALNENDDICGTSNDNRFENHLYSFSSFIPIKSKKDFIPKEEIIRSESDDPLGKITYGAFNYAPKGDDILRHLGASKTRTAFCSNMTTAYKKILDALLYLKKNEAVHMGLSQHSIIIKEDGLVLLDGVKYVRFCGDLNEHSIKTTVNDKANELSPIFAPIELSLLLFLFNNDVPTVSPNNVRLIIGGHMHVNAVLKRLPTAFQTDYINNCEASLHKYVNVPKKEIMSDVINNSCTWNMYTISVVFLTMLLTMQGYCSNLLKTGIFNKWFKLLLMNTHPDPKRRKTVEENISIFSKLVCVNSFAEFTPFLNEMTDDNLRKMFDQFNCVS